MVERNAKQGRLLETLEMNKSQMGQLLQQRRPLPQVLDLGETDYCYGSGYAEEEGSPFPLRPAETTRARETGVSSVDQTTTVRHLDARLEDNNQLVAQRALTLRGDVQRSKGETS